VLDARRDYGRQTRVTSSNDGAGKVTRSMRHGVSLRTIHRSLSGLTKYYNSRR